MNVEEVIKVVREYVADVDSCIIDTPPVDVTEPGDECRRFIPGDDVTITIRGKRK